MGQEPKGNIISFSITLSKEEMMEFYQLSICHGTRDLEDSMETLGGKQWKKKVMNRTERGAQNED